MGVLWVVPLVKKNSVFRVGKRNGLLYILGGSLSYSSV